MGRPRDPGPINVLIPEYLPPCVIGRDDVDVAVSIDVASREIDGSETRHVVI